MSPVISLVLLSINILTFVLSLSVLVLAVWQNPGTPMGRALSTFLASLVFLNATVIARLTNELFLGVSLPLELVAVYLSIDAFALCSLTAFALVVTSAGLMKQAFQVITRAGVVALLIMQWPLWNGRLFAPSADVTRLIETYTQAGYVSATVNLFFVSAGLLVAWRYRRRIGQPALLISVALLLLGQTLTIIFPPLRLISFPSLVASVVSVILGYTLARLQLYNPLIMRNAQLAAVRDLSQAMARQQGLQDVLDAVAFQVRTLINSGIALVLLVDYDGRLIVAAQNGGSTKLIGRKLAPGEGLAGRVLQTQQTMSIASYRNWNGRSPVFSDQPFCASLSVPLVDGDETVGVINIHELEPGRIYNERDRAVIEMLVSQATLGITHTRLHHAVNYWKTRAHAADKSAPPRIRFGDDGKIIEGEVMPVRGADGVLSLAGEALHPNDHTEFSDLIAAVLRDQQTIKRQLVMQVAPDLPALPMRLTTLQKVMNGALTQVIEMAQDGDDVLIRAHRDAGNVWLEVARIVHNQPGQPLDSVRIRLEN